MARIIKGGSDAAPVRSPSLRAPQVKQQGRKVVAKEVYSAGGKAEGIIGAAQADAQARAELAETQVQTVYQTAVDAQARASQRQAVADILGAYLNRGRTLAGARDQALKVVSGLVHKISSAPLSLPQEQSMPLVDAALKKRRGKYAATLHLGADEVDAIAAIAGMQAALDEAPELVLEGDGEGVLSLAAGQMPVDARMAAQVLCSLFELELPGDFEDPPPEDFDFSPQPVPDDVDEEPAADIPDDDEVLAADDAVEEEEVLAAPEAEDLDALMAEELSDVGFVVEEENPLTGQLAAAADADGPGTDELEADELQTDGPQTSGEGHAVEAEALDEAWELGTEGSAQDVDPSEFEVDVGTDATPTISPPVERSAIRAVGPGSRVAPLPPARPEGTRVESTNTRSSQAPGRPRSPDEPSVSKRVRTLSGPAPDEASITRNRVVAVKPEGSSVVRLSDVAAPEDFDEDPGARTVAIGGDLLEEVRRSTNVGPAPTRRPTASPPSSPGTRVDGRQPPPERKR